MTIVNTSIHPRVWCYGSAGAKFNTWKPRSRAKLDRQLAGVERHLETHPNDTMNQARRNIINATLKEMR